MCIASSFVVSRYGCPSTMFTIKCIHACTVETESRRTAALFSNQCIPHEAVVPKSSGSLFSVVIEVATVAWLAG